MSAALKLVPERRETETRELLAEEKTVLVGNPRAVAVAKFRELADKLESGELDGARVQWRDGLPVMETVTMDHEKVQLTQFAILGEV
jgi:hypothetical protein